MNRYERYDRPYNRRRASDQGQGMFVLLGILLVYVVLVVAAGIIFRPRIAATIRAIPHESR